MKKNKKYNSSKIEYVCDDREEEVKENRPIPPEILERIKKRAEHSRMVMQNKSNRQ